MCEKESVDKLTELHLQQRSFFLERLSGLEMFTLTGLAIIVGASYAALAKWWSWPICFLSDTSHSWPQKIHCILLSPFSSIANSVTTGIALVLIVDLLMIMAFRGKYYVAQIEAHEDWLIKKASSFCLADARLNFVERRIFGQTFFNTHRPLIRFSLPLIYVFFFIAIALSFLFGISVGKLLI